MKVLLVKDVYKLGRAGDVKKVADGFGRNFLLPQGLAVLATAGALKKIDHIRQKATIQRAELNNELSGLSDQVNGLVFGFAGKAGETGKLYGSITTQMIADVVNSKLGITKINRHQIECEPIRSLGEFIATVRLTMDLNPKVKIIVYREGELPASLQQTSEPEVAEVETPAVEAAATDDAKE
jgi:large subunit ribosomal protein L9